MTTENEASVDPRVAAGAKAWDKHMGGRYAPDEVEELSEEVAVILAAADAVDPRKPRGITTVEELDALSDGAVIVDADKNAYTALKRTDGTNWWNAALTYADGTAIALPATVLHEPKAEAAQ